jgi:hypothetical protein
VPPSFRREDFSNYSQLETRIDYDDHAFCPIGMTWLFSPGTLLSSSNKTGRHDITEIFLKVALNTINQTTKPTCIIHEIHLYCNHLSDSCASASVKTASYTDVK